MQYKPIENCDVENAILEKDFNLGATTYHEYSFLSPNYMPNKIQIVNKRYDINYSASKTLQHYVTLSDLLFCTQKHYHLSTQ